MYAQGDKQGSNARRPQKTHGWYVWGAFFFVCPVHLSTPWRGNHKTPPSRTSSVKQSFLQYQQLRLNLVHSDILIFPKRNPLLLLSPTSTLKRPGRSATSITLHPTIMGKRKKSSRKPQGPRKVSIPLHLRCCPASKLTRDCHTERSATDGLHLPVL